MEDSSAKRGQYRCEPCDKDFTTKKGWKKHSDKHHPVSDEGSECGDSMSFRTANSTTFYPCPYDDCDKFFNRPNRLKTHLLIHTGERPFKCEVEEGCNKSYARLEHLKRHVQNCHHGSPPEGDAAGLKLSHHQCSKCPKSFSNQHSLAKHFKRSHENPSRYKCIDCGLSFAKHNHLTVHQATVHQGREHPHKCPTCNKTFKFPNRLRNHIIEKHEKQHSCKECDEKYAKFTDLRRHVATAHKKEPKCDVCGQTFARKAYLLAHQVVHADTRPLYHCPHAPACKKKYTEERNLLAHVKAFHEATERLPCKHCHIKFSSRRKLFAHVKSEHPGERLYQRRQLRPTKVGPERAPRSDKGIPKKSMLITLTGGGVPSPPTPTDFDHGGSSDDQAVHQPAASDQESPTSNVKPPPPAAFASAVAAPLFDLRPQFAKKVSKNYLEGMLKRVSSISSNQHQTTTEKESRIDEEVVNDIEVTAFEAPKLSKRQGQTAATPKKTFNFFQYTKTSLN